MRAVIDRGEGQLVQPPGDRTRGRYVARGLTRPERDPENSVCRKRHRTGERGHIAVVHDHKPRPHRLADAQEKVLHQRIALRRDGAKERCDPYPVVDVHPGRTSADPVHTRHIRSRLVQRGDDLAVVIVRIGLDPRLPHDLLAEDHLPVDHRGHLAIGSTEVKPDTTTV